MFGHLPAYINFKKTNPEPFGDHNHTMVGTMAGTPSLAAAPGGAADATAPSAGSVPRIYIYYILFFIYIYSKTHYGLLLPYLLLVLNI